MRHGQEAALTLRASTESARRKAPIQTTILLRFCKTVRDLGGNPDLILRKAQITPRSLSQKGAVISASRVARLLEMAAHDLDTPEFGRRLAHEQAKIPYSGSLIATMFRNSPTLRHWFQLLNSISQAYNPFIDLGIVAYKGGDVVVFYPQKTTSSMRQIGEFTIMGCAFQVEKVAHPGVVREINLVFPEAAPPTWKSELDGKVNYGESRNALIFDTGVLDTEIAGSDIAIFREAQDQISYLFPDLSGRAFSNSALWHLVSREGAMTSEEIAQLMRLSTRTFRRRIAEEGNTFQSMRLDIIRDRALKLVLDKRIALNEVSRELGYSNQASLTRSFRRWFDATPMQIRRRGGLN